MTSKLFLRTSTLALLLLIGVSAHAAAMTLSLSTTGDGVQVRVVGDPSARMTLDYSDSDGDSLTLSLGTTDSGGYLETTVDTSDRDIMPGTSVSVVSSATGARSNSAVWPLPDSAELSLPFDTFPLPLGQSTSISFSDPDDLPLSLKSNTNASVASASVSGSQLNMYGKANGSTVVTVCFSGFPSDCDTLTVTVGGSGTAGSQALEVSQSNPVIVKGQTTIISVNGLTQPLYLSSNSNPEVAQVNILNNSITIVGNAVGSTNVTVCTSSSACDTLPVSVLAEPAAGATASITPSRDSVSVSVGQSTTVLIAGPGSYTVSSNQKSVASTTLMNGSNVIIMGVAPGRATVSACDPSDDCAYILVNVSAAPAASIPAPSTVSPPASAAVFDAYLSPGSEGAEVTLLQQTLAAQGYFSGTATGFYGTVTENAVIAFQKAHGLDQLGVVGPNTRAALNGLSGNAATTPAATTGDGYVFSNFIGTGSTSTDVTELQKRLAVLGIYSGPVTGYFGALTQAAVESFQTNHDISAVGYVGPSTRAALNGN